MGKVRKRTAVALVLAAAGLSAAAAALDSYLDPFDDRPFDPAAWAAADPYGRMATARGAVRRIRPGTSEAEVVGLLGRPTRVENTRRHTGSPATSSVRTYSYYVGSSSLTSWRGLDDAFVWVHLAEDGRVVAAEIGGG